MKRISVLHKTSSTGKAKIKKTTIATHESYLPQKLVKPLYSIFDSSQAKLEYKENVSYNNIHYYSKATHIYYCDSPKNIVILLYNSNLCSPALDPMDLANF